MQHIPSLKRQCLAEIVGTYLLVIIGLGAVQTAILTGAHAGLWPVALMWGIGATLAVYVTAAVSGAHINPAMTVAFAAFRGFPWRRVPLFILSQVTGAFLAAATLYLMFSGPLAHYEHAAGIVRGTSGSEMSAMCYGGYFPSPGMAKAAGWDPGVVTLPQAMFIEGLGTALLAFFVFALIEGRNTAAPGHALAPWFVGLAIAVIVAVIAPLTTSCINPARDFGPRLFSYFAGWGSVAIPGPHGEFFWVYILAPVLGALVGATAYCGLIRPGLRHAETPAATGEAKP